ncbi:hypothetical protein [Corynebacterium bovis]|uniref:Uncharacterized protein n=1 Tax=Corynebacterium bovis DSM 20582 = CIP 54.80 TaxID=927655 RepID=A0A8I0CLY7_9CORY|nr:hypothetical protein [Corynebacterium bovis]MBB3115078.1 hypothetical protein [Corynebacterium bovis DSM 20582 = CIP 54.80]MDK8510422.1 hypothetical protein [Corynebacterium bovis]QQC47948.1 hypothetical protein I6I09_03210 [Corynebacterium bovis]RRO96961.1 hypothetical protein CXF29_00340 [Corynebacterium bovis]RRQ12339.1 hypothetical protein CXF47_09440 [Corynebacterium bovis]
MDPATAPLMIVLDRRTPGPGDCFRPDAPVTVPLCPGLAAVVTAGGRPVTLPATGATSAWTVWDDAARAMLAHLADLTAAHGSALRRRTLDGAAGVTEVAVVDDAYPASSLLTHPGLLAPLRAALDTAFGTEPLLWAAPDGRLFAHPWPVRPPVAGAAGPLAVVDDFPAPVRDTPWPRPRPRPRHGACP